MIAPRVLSLAGIVFCSCILAVQCSSLLDSFAKVVHVCFYKHNSSLSECVKERSYIALDNVYRTTDEIRLIPNFISLVLYDGAKTNERSAKILLSDIENQSPENKSTLVNNLIIEKIYDFLESRAINVKIPITAFDLFGLLENDKEVES